MAWRRWFDRLRGRAGHDRDAEMARELQDHHDLGTQKFRAAGLSREGSENAARRYPGDTTLIQEEIHPVWTSTVLDRRGSATSFRVFRV
jgi:hypothetical protein